jgi:hypothetical protein
MAPLLFANMGLLGIITMLGAEVAPSKPKETPAEG